MTDSSPDSRHDLPSEIKFRSGRVGPFRSSFWGYVHSGEGGTESIARSVVYALNQRGERWGMPAKPAGPESGIDYVAEGPRGQLQIQITRVPPDATWYRDARTYGGVEREVSPESLALELIEGVRKKCAITPPQVRPSVLLALDGTREIGYDTPQTLRVFWSRFGEEAISCGFQDVVLVGGANVRSLVTKPPDDDAWIRLPGA